MRPFRSHLPLIVLLGVTLASRVGAQGGDVRIDEIGRAHV